MSEYINGPQQKLIQLFNFIKGVLHKTGLKLQDAFSLLNTSESHGGKGPIHWDVII